MTRSAVLLSCVILGACTTIRINDDETSTIEYEGGVEVAKDLTNSPLPAIEQALAAA